MSIASVTLASGGKMSNIIKYSLVSFLHILLVGRDVADFGLWNGDNDATRGYPPVRPHEDAIIVRSLDQTEPIVCVPNAW